MAFDPGELSTIVGPVEKRFSSSKVFDPADLPCPPRNVMVRNLSIGVWQSINVECAVRELVYTNTWSALSPFAFPDKVRRVIPDLAYCNAFYFNVFDPPRTLRPVAAVDPEISRGPAVLISVDALDPPTTTVHPTPTSQPPRPSSVQDPGPTKTPLKMDTGGPILPQPGHATHVSNPTQTDAGGDSGSGGDPDTGGNRGTASDPGTVGSSGAGEDPRTLDGHSDQPSSIVLGGGELATPTTKESNVQHPVNPGQNTPQSDPPGRSVHDDQGQSGGSPGRPGQINGISVSDSPGSTPLGSDPRGGNSQDGDPQGGNLPGGNGQGGNAGVSIIQSSAKSGSTGSPDPDSIGLGSSSGSSGSSGSDSHGSREGSNHYLPGDEDVFLTTIQLGEKSITRPTTIHLGNSGDNEQAIKSAAVINPALDAPFIPPRTAGPASKPRIK